MPKKIIASNETCVKINGSEYRIYAATDIDRNQILSIRAYSSRNMLAMDLFIKRF
jgi:transposase-like protein